MRLTVNGHRLYYELHGAEGVPTVVLLHHGLGSSKAWRRQVPVLTAAGFRVLAYDRWGYGASAADRPRLHTPWFEPDVADLAALLDALGIDRPLLVGHSDGGNIALYFAAQYPERPRAVVAVAAHVVVEPAMQPGMEALKRVYETSSVFRRALERTHPGHGEQVFFDLWYRGWHRPGVQGWNALPLLQKVRVPVLVVQGTADEYASPKHAEDIAAALPYATLHLIPGAPHMVPQDAAEAFNAVLVPFLVTQRAQRGDAKGAKR